MLFFGELIYLPLAGIIRLTCLLFYRRLFNPSPMTMFFIWGGMAFTVAGAVSMFFGSLFNCLPVRASWDFLVHGRCIEPKALPYASGAINVIGDLWVLILPIPCIWGLNLPLTRKVKTLAIFGLGILYDRSFVGSNMS